MNTMLKRDSMPGERLRSQNPTESAMSNRQNQFNNCRVLCSLTNVRLSIAQIAHLLQGALKLGPLDSKKIYCFLLVSFFVAFFFLLFSVLFYGEFKEYKTGKKE